MGRPKFLFPVKRKFLPRMRAEPGILIIAIDPNYTEGLGRFYSSSQIREKVLSEVSQEEGRLLGYKAPEDLLASRRWRSFDNPRPSEPYLLSYRLPRELKGVNPAKLYLRRMSIEESFRDAKGVLKLVELLRGVKDPQIEEGLAFLVFSSLAFLRGLAEEALERISSNFPLTLVQKLFGSPQKGLLLPNLLRVIMPRNGV